MRTNTPSALWLRVACGAPDECWEWTGARKPNGYGCISVAGRDLATHRLAYELSHGEIPNGAFVCHRCDNRACCNPGHLFAGSPGDNSRDMHSKGRWPSRKGSQHPMAKLTERDVLAIRDRRAAGERGRDLAREFGVCASRISALTRHPDREWSHA